MVCTGLLPAWDELDFPGPRRPRISPIHDPLLTREQGRMGSSLARAAHILGQDRLCLMQWGPTPNL